MFIAEYFFELVLWQQFLILYFFVINLITFFYYGVDKIKARFGSSRISEKMLWILALIGGSVGALAGMKFFRHKTKKISFQAVIAVILALQVGIIFYILQ
jgi:uncharacterized membrane protein YsdA (DUF1294 family)